MHKLLKKKASIELISTKTLKVRYKNNKLYFNDRDSTEIEETFTIPDKYAVKKLEKEYAIIIKATQEILFTSPSEITCEFGVYTSFTNNTMYCFIVPENTLYTFAADKYVIVFRYTHNLYYNYKGFGYVYDLNKKTTIKINKMTDPSSLVRLELTPTTKILHCSITGSKILETYSYNTLMLKGNSVYIFDGKHIQQKNTNVYTELYKIVRR